MRLHTRLALLMAVAAGPAVTLLVLSLLDEREHMRADIHDRARAAARSVALHEDSTIQGVRHVLIALGPILPQFENDRQLCAQATDQLSAEVGNKVLLTVLRGDGTVLCGRSEPLPKDDPGEGQPAGDASATGDSSITKVRIGGSTEAPMLSLSEPVTIDGRIVGAVAASISLEWLIERMGHYPLEAETTIMLLDRNGHVLARRPDPQNWLGRRIPDQALEAVRPRRTEERTHDIEGLGPRPFIAASAPVPSFPDALFVLVGLDRDAGLAAVARHAVAESAILGLVVLALIATAAASWHIAGTLVRRERGLSEAKAAVERIAEAQQRIADTIGHDLRNSVQTLVSFLRNLRRNGDRPPDPAMMPHVARAIGDLRSALDVLVRASRLEANALEPQKRTVELAAFLMKIESDWQFYAETKGLKLKVTAARERVYSDPDLLRTIVSNLVSNAIKHTATGSVSVSSQTEPDGRIAIAVRDTGDGVPPDKAKVIFDAFSRLEPEKTEGLGLGLSICKRSADLLGCELSLAPDTGGGACFVVRLPAAPASGKQA